MQLQKIAKLMWREQSECREHNMTQKLSDSHYVRNKERTSLLPLKCLQIIFFFLSEDFSVYIDDVVNWLKNNNSRTSMNFLWTLWELLCCYWSRRCVFLNFDVIVPLIKSFNLIQRHVKQHCPWNINCCTQKREFKVIQNIKFSQNREI